MQERLDREQPGEQRYKNHAYHGYTSTGHELLHALRFCARIIISVALKQVNYAPDTKSGTERDNEGLQNGNCLIKKFHITSLSAAFCGGKKLFVLDFG